jgi:regulator of replication initiation timing
MRLACGLAVGLAVLVAGCDSQTQNSTDSEAKNLQARVASLTRENAGLKASVDTLKAENTAMDRKMSGLKSENSQLKRQLELASAPARPTAASAAKPDVANNTLTLGSPTGIVVQGGKLPGTITTVLPAGPAVMTPEQTAADLETRIAALRPKVLVMRNKVTELSRSTVDIPTPVPPGGIIQNGTVFKKESMIVAPFYRLVPVGPAVKKGDFRTADEKEEAVKKAKAEWMPLDQELKSLVAEQTAAKNKLKTTTSAPDVPVEQPEAQPAR